VWEGSRRGIWTGILDILYPGLDPTIRKKVSKAFASRWLTIKRSRGGQGDGGDGSDGSDGSDGDDGDDGGAGGAGGAGGPGGAGGAGGAI
jgi:hypothetical protein